MKVFVIDDEALAVRRLALLLGGMDGVEIAGTFTSAKEAIEASRVVAPDVAFLDINMPEIGGIEVAERLQTLHDKIEIVFITAYEEYAIKAFELNAVDYLLKPVQPQRLAMTVTRLQEKIKTNVYSADVSGSRFARIQCFQGLKAYGADGEPLTWRTAKARELFAYLVYRQGQLVRKETLLDLLWPDIDEKKAFTQLYTTIYRLRKTFESAGVPVRIENSGNGYTLKLANCPVDAEEWQSRLAGLLPLAAETAQSYADVLELYRGDYMADQDYAWAESERQRLRSLMIQYAMQLGRIWTDAGKWNEAMELYLRVQRTVPLFEEIYIALMELHGLMGQVTLAEKQYEMLRNMMKKEYDAEPSRAASEIFKALKAGK